MGCSTHCVNPVFFLQSLDLIARRWPTHSEIIGSNCTATPKRMYVALPPTYPSMNTKLKAFFARTAIAIALIPQAEAQNTNHTPGYVISWGDQVIPNVAPGTRFIKIAAGGNHSLALESDRTVV